MTPNVPNEAAAAILGACRVPGYSKPEEHLADLVMNQVKEYGPEAMNEMCGFLSAAIISTLSLYLSVKPRNLNLLSLAAGIDDTEPMDRWHAARLGAQQYLTAWNEEDEPAMHELVNTHQGKALLMLFDLCTLLYTVNIAYDNMPGEAGPVSDETIAAMIAGAERDPGVLPLADPVYLVRLLDNKHGDPARRQLLDALAEKMCTMLDLDTVRQKNDGTPLQLIIFDVNGLPFDDLEPAVIAQQYVTAWLQNDEPAMTRLASGTCVETMFLATGLCSVLHWLHLGQKASR